MECGVLSMAVLRQDETLVKKILEQRPSFLRTERNIFGHTAIHLAIGWPGGLKVLLAAADESTWQSIDDNEYRFNGDYPDSPWSTPLDYAIAFGCVESIRLLADADLAFNFDWNFRVGTKALDPTISDVVLALILERFQQLYDFALQNLPAEAVRALQIEGFEFFDSKARSLLDYFHTINIPMPRKFRGHRDFWDLYPSGNLVYFCPPFGGIFHQSELRSEAAKAFFDAGILNVDYEVEQVTPLMTVAPPNYVDEHQ